MGSELLRLVTLNPTCTCELEKWNEYALCQHAFQGAMQAFSFGILGYDHWGKYVQSKHGLVPYLYDCYHVQKPADFQNAFFPVCWVLQQIKTKTGVSLKRCHHCLPLPQQLG